MNTPLVAHLRVKCTGARAQAAQRFTCIHLQGPHCTGKMEEKKSLSGKTGILEILSKQGILFAEIVNSLIQKVKDIAIFAVYNSYFFLKSWICLPSQFCVRNSHSSHKLAQGKFAVGQEKHREFEKYNLSGDPAPAWY